MRDTTDDSDMWVKRLEAAFDQKADSSRAMAMSAYMKNHFKFKGLASPIRKQLQKQFFKEAKNWNKSVLLKTIQELWKKDEREFQYAAVELLIRKKKDLTREELPLIEYLVLTKSWWDTVDSISSNLVGPILTGHREDDLRLLDIWIHHENMWLNRTALLHQLKYRESLNFDLLKEFIRIKKSHKEFFIQKAIGWALREYSKVNAKAVHLFVTNTSDLSGLARREALKWMNRQNKQVG